MSATLAPPPRDDADGPAPAKLAPREIRATGGDPILPLWPARLIAFAALALWGSLHWMSMLEPAEPGRGCPRRRPCRPP